MLIFTMNNVQRFLTTGIYSSESSKFEFSNSGCLSGTFMAMFLSLVHLIFICNYTHATITQMLNKSVIGYTNIILTNLYYTMATMAEGQYLVKAHLKAMVIEILAEV